MTEVPLKVYPSGRNCRQQVFFPPRARHARQCRRRLTGLAGAREGAMKHASSGGRERFLVEKFLRRGLQVLGVNPDRGLLLPPARDEESLRGYYEYLKKYSFRLFIRDVIRCRDCMSIGDLQKYCSEKAARNYLDLLLEWGMLIALPGDRYRLLPGGIHSFGDTFEWFVAQVFIREFFCPAVWNVRFGDMAAGGDYDVIASVEEKLLYVEAKSSPPKHVDSSEVAAFLARVESLRPHCCIFLEDTHLRMQDKIAVLFEQELAERLPRSRVVRLEREIFSIGTSVFIVNSRPDLVSNLRTCIACFLRSSGLRLS